MTVLNFPNSPTNGQIYSSDGTTWIYSSSIGAWNIASNGLTGFTGSIGFTGSVGATLLGSNNVWTGTNQFTTIELGNSTDTTLSRVSSGVVSIEGKRIYTTAGLVDFAETQAADAVGTRGISQVSTSAAYTLVAADAGKHILHPSSDNNARTFTIPANTVTSFPIGTVVTFINQINTVTIAISSDTMTLAGSTSTGNRTLAVNGMATAIKITTSSWLISGAGLT